MALRVLRIIIVGEVLNMRWFDKLKLRLKGVKVHDIRASDEDISSLSLEDMKNAEPYVTFSEPKPELDAWEEHLKNKIEESEK